MCADGVSLAGAEIYNTVGKLAGVVDSGAIIALDANKQAVARIVAYHAFKEEETVDVAQIVRTETEPCRSVHGTGFNGIVEHFACAGTANICSPAAVPVHVLILAVVNDDSGNVVVFTRADIVVFLIAPFFIFPFIADHGNILDWAFRVNRERHLPLFGALPAIISQFRTKCNSKFCVVGQGVAFKVGIIPVKLLVIIGSDVKCLTRIVIIIRLRHKTEILAVVFNARFCICNAVIKILNIAVQSDCDRIDRIADAVPVGRDRVAVCNIAHRAEFLRGVNAVGSAKPCLFRGRYTHRNLHHRCIRR